MSSSSFVEKAQLHLMHSSFQEELAKQDHQETAETAAAEVAAEVEFHNQAGDFSATAPETVVAVAAEAVKEVILGLVLQAAAVALAFIFTTTVKGVNFWIVFLYQLMLETKALLALVEWEDLVEIEEVTTPIVAVIVELEDSVDSEEMAEKEVMEAHHLMASAPKSSLFPDPTTF